MTITRSTEPLAQQAMRTLRTGTDFAALAPLTDEQVREAAELTGQDVTDQTNAIAVLEDWAHRQQLDGLCQRLHQLGGPMVAVAASCIAPTDSLHGSGFLTHHTAEAFTYPPVGPGNVRLLGLVRDTLDGDRWPSATRLVIEAPGLGSQWLGDTLDEAYDTALRVEQAVRDNGDDEHAFLARLWTLRQWALSLSAEHLVGVVRDADAAAAESAERLGRMALGAPFLRAAEQIVPLTERAATLHASLDPRL